MNTFKQKSKEEPLDMKWSEESFKNFKKVVLEKAE